MSNELIHYGTKGMRWGERKAQKIADREQLAKDQSEFYGKKAERIMSVATGKKESLIALKTPHDAVIVTGREFIDHMSKGGLMDIRMTDVFAVQNTKDGPYELNDNPNAPFVPKARR